MRELAFLPEATVAALEEPANPVAGQQIEPREVETKAGRDWSVS
jgi:hypothetical protein